MSTYTREQLEQTTDESIDVVAAKLSGKEFHSECDKGCFVYIEEWEDPTLFQPTKRVHMSDIVEKAALKHNGEAYARNLDNVVCKDDEWSEGLTFEGIGNLLGATPRQRTIAAILTLQGESGGTGE